MKSKTATFIIVGLLILIALFFVLSGISQAAPMRSRSVATLSTTSDTTDTDTVLPKDFSKQIAEVPSRSGAHCFDITVDQPIKNHLGKTQAWPAAETEWCSGRYLRKVTDLPYFHCFSKGGFYAYDGCNKDVGDTGYSYLGANANWHYHWLINGLVFDKTPALSMRLYPDGHVTGMWYWWTG